MRRHVVHITAALLAFTVGFLTASTLGNLAYALSLALTLFLIAKIIPRLDIDLHFVMVATLSLLLWAAGAYAFFSVFSTGSDSCVVDFSGEEISHATPAVPFDTVITLERTGCFGSCPSYTLSIFSDGSVIFYGAPRHGFTRVTGAVKSWISQEQIRQLLAEFDGIGYFSLNDRYKSVGDGCPAVATDSPSAITSLQINGRKKTIEHYHGCKTEGRNGAVFPQQLTKLETRIDEIVGSQQWVK